MRKNNDVLDGKKINVFRITIFFIVVVMCFGTIIWFEYGKREKSDSDKQISLQYTNASDVRSEGVYITDVSEDRKSVV